MQGRRRERPQSLAIKSNIFTIHPLCQEKGKTYPISTATKAIVCLLFVVVCWGICLFVGVFGVCVVLDCWGVCWGVCLYVGMIFRVFVGALVCLFCVSFA